MTITLKSTIEESIVRYEDSGKVNKRATLEAIRIVLSSANLNSLSDDRLHAAIGKAAKEIKKDQVEDPSINVVQSYVLVALRTDGNSYDTQQRLRELLSSEYNSGKARRGWTFKFPG